jgi:hypothetical protein
MHPTKLSVALAMALTMPNVVFSELPDAKPKAPEKPASRFTDNPLVGQEKSAARRRRQMERANRKNK